MEPALKPTEAPPEPDNVIELPTRNVLDDALYTPPVAYHDSVAGGPLNTILDPE
jgi:hypothetical protein